MWGVEPEPESERPQGPKKLLLPTSEKLYQQTHGISASLRASADTALQRLASSLLMAHSGHLMTFQSSSYGCLTSPSFAISGS